MVRKPEIQVVTDDSAVRKLVSGMLAGEGLRLVYADDGEQAVAVVARVRPELGLVFAQEVQRVFCDGKLEDKLGSVRE